MAIKNNDGETLMVRGNDRYSDENLELATDESLKSFGYYKLTKEEIDNRAIKQMFGIPETLSTENTNPFKYTADVNKDIWQVWRNKLNDNILDVKIVGGRATGWKQRLYGSGDLVFSDQAIESAVCNDYEQIDDADQDW